MRFRRDAPALILGTAVVVIAALAAYSNSLFANQMAVVEENQYSLMRTIVDFNLQGGQDRALSRAEILASTPEIRDAFEARDRERLLTNTQEMFAIQRDKYGVDQLQFITQDNISFLRVNNPAKFGDDLSSFRPIIVAVNRDHTVRKGISLSRSGPALVGAVPMVGRDGQYTGVVEMGLDFGPILDKLKATYGFDSTFFVKEDLLRDIATGVSPDVLDEHNRVGEYLKYHSTNWEMMKALIESGDLARVNGEPVQYVREYLGSTYGVVMVSLHNAAGDPIGIVTSTRDFGDTRSAAGRVMVAQGASSFFALIVLAGAVLITIRGFLLRPLAEVADGMASLAKGDPSVVVESKGVCEELESTISHYEALRQTMAAKDGE